MRRGPAHRRAVAAGAAVVSVAAVEDTGAGLGLRLTRDTAGSGFLPSSQARVSPHRPGLVPQASIWEP